jgi:hypothetical protein
MEPRLKTKLVVSALIRRAQAEGGFAAVLASGDSEAGSILLVLAEKGRRVRFLERLLQPNGNYLWQPINEEALANPEESERFLQRRRKYDPDIWLIELDVASAERLIAELNELV